MLQLMQKEWHKNWKTLKGETIMVSPLEFIEYYKEDGQYFQWKEEDKLYEGEIWRCRLPNREIKFLPFRVEVNPLDKDSYTKNTSLTSNPTPLIDKYPNPVTDSWEEVTLGIISKDLFPRLELLGDYIRILVDLENIKLYPKVVEARLKLIDCENQAELVQAFTNYCMLNTEQKKAVSKIIYEKLYP